ncbi:hypothetical protein CFP56_031526 [Quercus suber]|uniref:Uncharacterized protein n=1 Tax=Quercus suber TaxID=58331 RepID=A0AAW0LSA1_QUESU
MTETNTHKVANEQYLEKEKKKELEQFSQLGLFIFLYALSSVKKKKKKKIPCTDSNSWFQLQIPVI